MFFSQNLVDLYGNGSTLIKVETALEGLERVKDGTADLFIGSSRNSYLLGKYQFFDLTATFEFFEHPTPNVLALQAMRYDTLGERPVALEKLAKALDLAEPGGFIRLFVDLGPQMADLLKQLLNKKNVAVDYIKQILAAFSEDGRSLSPSPSHPSPQPLVDPLTHRELDILELLAQRLQNKEIAEKLFISDQTVKGHLKNIYQKLNVRNRRQAVEKARKIGILSGGV